MESQNGAVGTELYWNGTFVSSLQALDEWHFFSFAAKLRPIGDLIAESGFGPFNNPSAGTILANYLRSKGVPRRGRYYLNCVGLK